MPQRVRRRRTRAAMIIEREMKMPLTKKGAKIKRAMQQEYGAKKGESVFYASINKGKVKGAEKRGARKGK